MSESWSRILGTYEHFGRTGWLLLALTALTASGLVMAAALIGDPTGAAQRHASQGRQGVACEPSVNAMGDANVWPLPRPCLWGPARAARHLEGPGYRELDPDPAPNSNPARLAPTDQGDFK